MNKQDKEKLKKEALAEFERIEKAMHAAYQKAWKNYEVTCLKAWQAYEQKIQELETEWTNKPSNES